MSKIYNSDCIILDGRMDEAVWAEVPEQTGLRFSKSAGGELAPVQTSFKMIPCADRIYLGIKCDEPDMAYVNEYSPKVSMWNTDTVEIFLSPSCNSFDFYQFVVTFTNETVANFNSEGGNIRPDPFAPDWNRAIYKGDDFWSVEIELPLTAFYMTPNAVWSDKWLVNVCRSRNYREMGTNRLAFMAWSPFQYGYKESATYRTLEGFPMRPGSDDVRISRALVDITDKTDKGYCGTIAVTASVPEDTDYIFISDASDAQKVSLKSGSNEFTVPCCFREDGRLQLGLCLKRISDGKEFKRSYPVFIDYRPIRLELTLPEYRGNFYPGQDASKIVGKVIAVKACTVTLEGPGIPGQTVTPAADGSFCFETPNFEIGDALLTVTNSAATLTKKIRRLAPTGRTMTWISGGNLIMNGKPVLRRNLYAEYYKGGEAFKLRYDADDLHQTPGFDSRTLEPARLIKGADAPGGEALKDAMPSDAMLEKIREMIDKSRDADFAYYYISDEPECRGLSPIYLQHIYDYVTERDPYHVILSASREASKHLEIADWFEAHPYINPYTDENGKRIYGRAINTLGDCVECISKLNRPDKCIGFLPTCFAAMGAEKEPYPTFDEMICHVWAPMIRGGKTLWPYAYHDVNDRASLYEGTRYVHSSFEAVEDLILMGKRTTLIRNLDVESVLYETDTEKMFVLVNMTNEPQTVTLEGLTGRWYNFRNSGKLTGNTFALKPLQVLIGTSQVKDAGLPTYAETATLIDSLEAKRTGRGSIFFERQKDIKLSGSVGGFWKLKLFDGTLDNYAWSQRGDGDKYVELDLTKVATPFTKVIVHGWNIEDMDLKVINGGERTEPAIASRTVDGYAVTFELAEAVNPEALRIEMHNRYVELYEVEAF